MYRDEERHMAVSVTRLRAGPHGMFSKVIVCLMYV
jgi:hypothetical protein